MLLCNPEIVARRRVNGIQPPKLILDNALLDILELFEQLLTRRTGLVVGGGIDELLVRRFLGDASDGDEGGSGASGEDFSEGWNFLEGDLRRLATAAPKTFFLRE